MKYLGQTGDTIIEVLLAMAVVSSVLGGAYATSNRSLNGSRQAQERGEALKLVEGQIEKLKSVTTTDIYAEARIFCVKDDLTPDPTNKDHGFMPALDSDDTIYPASCQGGDDGRYKLSIDRSVDNSAYTFTVRARWDRFGGGRDEMSVLYRTYQ